MLPGQEFPFRKPSTINDGPDLPLKSWANTKQVGSGPEMHLLYSVITTNLLNQRSATQYSVPTQSPTTSTSCTSRIHGMVRTIIVMKRGTKLPTRRAREATSKYKNRINLLQARLRALFAVVDYAVLHDGSLPEPAPQGDPLQICTATCCIIGKRPSPAPKTKTSTIKRTLRQPKNSLVARSDRVLRPRANLDSNRKA